MLHANEIQMLASRPRRRDKSVLTLYLDTDQSKQANLNRGFETELKEMATGIKVAITDPIQSDSFDEAFRRLEDFVYRNNISSRGLVAVVDLVDKFVWSEPLNLPLSNRLQWDTEVLIEPLVAAAVENEIVGIALVDRAHLRLLTMSLGEIQELAAEDFDHQAVRHTKTVGMDKLGASSHANQRADEQVRLNLQRMVKQIDSMVSLQKVRRLVLAGSADVVAKLKNCLPKRLASFVIGTIDSATNAPVDQIGYAAAAVAQKFESESAKTTVTELVTLAEKGAPVVTSLAHTLDAANHGRVWKLVSAEGCCAPGYECTECPALFTSNSGPCSLCGAPLRRVEDVVERVIARASGKGAKVEVVRGDAAALLKNTAFIGAFLRTRTGKHGGSYESEGSFPKTLAGSAETTSNAGNI